MRSTVIAAAFALAIGAAATVNIEYRPDGSIERITNSNPTRQHQSVRSWPCGRKKTAVAVKSRWVDADIGRLPCLTDKGWHRI